jgi:hypothetical protein
MYALTLAVASAVHAVPKECHIDCSNWTGVMAVKITVRVTTTDGTVFEYTGEFQPKTNPEGVRDVLEYRLGELGLHGYQVGKSIYVLQGAKKSTVRSVEFISKSWKPDVRWAFLPPQKK